MYSSTHSLTSALVGGEWSASRTDRFTSRERAPVTHWIGGWVGPIAVLDAVVKRIIPRTRPIFSYQAGSYTSDLVICFCEVLATEKALSQDVYHLTTIFICNRSPIPTVLHFMVSGPYQMTMTQRRLYVLTDICRTVSLPKKRPTKFCYVIHK
jgi:hypothetical protein